ncbi:acyltransferase family protein [Glaciibacter superstes]|uniref:acyltransferase family protein n=1 Tax=Glaciibacter superstes TaxID=501023 RepID=UPI0003B3D3E7|nr:acyltransferase family protein [Glaciibacter superstes]
MRDVVSLGTRTPSKRAAVSPRIVGVDVARGLAIVGMFVAHAVPRPDDVELLVDGRSSILFATLAGVSLGIVTGQDQPLERGRRSDRVVSILLRAVCLFLLGGILAALDSGVAVILDYYAFMFLLLTPVLFLPRWALAALAAVIAVVAPMLAAVTDDRSEDKASLLDVLQYYLLDGVYPALIWMPFLLVGLIAARSGLRRRSTQVWMMIGGSTAAVLGYGAAWVIPGVSAEAHSGSTAEVLASGGVAIALTGALLWLTASERAGFGRAARAVLWPVGATGSMVLTVYTVQIVALAIFVALREDSGGQIEYPGWPLLIGMTAASLVFASLWRLWFGKGPLERLFTLVTTLPRRHERDSV